MAFRKDVNKNYSAKKFRNSTQRTKRINIAPPPMRGGIRL